MNVTPDSSHPKNITALGIRLAMVGLNVAVLFSTATGQINDIVSARYLPMAFQGNSSMFGLTFTFFSAGKLLMMFPMARLSDRIGRKPVLLITFVLYTLGAFLAGLAPSIELFLIFRFIKGMSSYEAVSLALINDLYPEGKRGKPIAFFSAALGVGYLLGSGIGGYFINWFDFQVAFIILGFITLFSVLSILILIRVFPSPQNIKTTPINPAIRPKIPVQDLFHYIFNHSGLFWGHILNLIISFCYAGVSTYMLYVILNYFNVPTAQVGFALFPISGIYIALVLLIGHRENSVKLMRIGLLLLIASLSSVFLLKYYDNLGIFLTGAIISSASFGILLPSLDNFISNQVPADIRGRLLGIYRSIGLIGSIFGSSITGYIGSKFWAFSPFLVIAGILILGALISFRFLEMTHTHKIKNKLLIGREAKFT
jgi:MFS family permease